MRYEDNPGNAGRWHFLIGSWTPELETCAVCFDNGNCGRVLSCFHWKFASHDPFAFPLNSLELEYGWGYWGPPSSAFNTIESFAIADKCIRLGLGQAGVSED